MSSNGTPFTTVTFEDGSVAVVKRDAHKPQLLEVIAIFLEALFARDYADRENSRLAEPQAMPAEAPPQRPAQPAAAAPAATELSPRQSAVMEALRAKMDEQKQVTAKAGDLARTAQIPLGSLHSVLQSLEKKELIKTVRGGSARAPAVYQVV